MKKIRKNILKLFLFICLGLTITTIAIAAALDPPGRPGQPLIIDYWKTGCTIEYTAPNYNGGSPITGYTTESRYKDEDKWVDRGTIKQLRRNIDDMREGAVAVFRVFARNKAGVSAPSEESP